MNQRKRATSCIPTDTPEMGEIEKKEMEKKDKEEQKRKKEECKKNLFAKKRKFRSRDIYSDEDSGEEEREISLHDDLDEDEWIPEVASSTFEELNRDAEPNDFVLVQFKAKKDVFYIGKVVEVEKGSNVVKINFLRKSSKVDGHFIFPAILDTAFVSIDDIKIILPTKSIGKQKTLAILIINFKLILAN
ncbi:hypothetical protein JTB14_009269 [Gonioctena quinquepunctata]|nr:hypothetical protein JTB14_009269 [Gonioctena quinquepunctata]